MENSKQIPAILRGLRLPVIAAPMFTVSYPELVLAQCKAGIVGSFPALNARKPGELNEWLMRMDEDLQAYKAANPDAVVGPVAVNQVSHASNTRLAEDAQVCIDHEVPIIISSLRAPVQEIVDGVHSYGGIILHDVINLRHALKALESGVDGLILVAAGAGGHTGTMSPLALIAEIRQHFDGPIALSGAIASGNNILAAQVMGADFAYIGTRFIACQEANASELYKDIIIESGASDIICSNLFSGIHGNYLRKSIELAGFDADNLAVADRERISLSKDGEGIKAWRDILGAGQGVSQIYDAPTMEEIVFRLENEYKETINKIKRFNF